ncbi:MAG: hypothetical protein IT431_16665 [Phycisphaerales bacterium]|nr:hypothetical protein [Phycisphaerales bacterium]
MIGGQIGGMLGPLVWGVLAQAGSAGRNTPIRTIIEQNREAGVEPLRRVELPMGLLAVMLGVALAAGLTAWWINHQARHRPAPETRAFIRLARGHGLGKRSMHLAAELAAQAGLAPVALLASPALLRAAVEGADQSTWSRRPGWDRLALAARGGG